MRIDKYLKVSRVVKRRTVANEVCSAGRVLINDKVAKPGTEVKVGDIVTIKFGNGETRFRILTIKETVRKEEASEMYELLEGTEVE
ncbi:MAG: RNA-binding S4 domain-containing protein [Clostridiales bacterium]|nr:RNA-binding S4 domain-containing protein [Clostridiales bacterium]MBR5417169.1 RNA-binding S4 domain-containing protein [Clostridiales bacterium]